ncbi:hypothetical protein BD626DRAFT_272723 [Schizophyllum amplum]|uniref:RBR-type E3 ubiquitin transferase n=1 Tax=Schizophyllum amplum TaxID=97359 RepID=A0A550CFD3_9AGAR|nr:hypothetical protein BD626DRAFT_272723 [Auriculariopsis ampla]
MAAADVSSELLIAQLLEQDLDALRSAREAERIHLDQAMAASHLAAGRIPKNTYKRNIPSPSDSEVALELYLAEQIANADAAYAENLRTAQQASIAVDFQFAQKLAAAERKAALDAEFAKRLQAEDEDGRDVGMNVDAEGMLSRDEMDMILSRDPNDKGKGKGKDKVSDDVHAMNVSADIPTGALVCGICLDAFQLTYSPITASNSANTSNKLPFGLRLPCPKEHPYCIDCLSSHIKSKLDPNGDGTGNGPSSVVFPIRCPECPNEDWPTGIPDNIAQRVLSEKGMVMWHTQKLLDSIPKLYCPNKQCSALVQAHEDTDEPMAECPSCTQTMCVSCRVAWHSDLTCEEFQALPPDERSPEDQLLLELARAKHWRRCPDCQVIVELIVGCNHMICRCGTHFCFRCGSLWKKGRGRNPGQCTRDPPCDLWDEEMLLDDREQERQARAEAVQAAVPPPPIPEPPRHYAVGIYGGIPRIPTPPPAYRTGHLNWMDDPHVLCTRHWFTAGMVRDLRCGYCDVLLNSLADLRYHLEHVTRHPVYACCGRFFRKDVDFERHLSARPARFGEHVHRFENQ